MNDGGFLALNHLWRTWATSILNKTIRKQQLELIYGGIQIEHSGAHYSEYDGLGNPEGSRWTTPFFM